MEGKYLLPKFEYYLKDILVSQWFQTKPHWVKFYFLGCGWRSDKDHRMVGLDVRHEIHPSEHLCARWTVLFSLLTQSKKFF